eukprot:TRINITY_DN465_c0_g1_i4.p1 TRINITY_DN465_c0_g1~~TRINITY_DN465_c0_g1_i4.p1  ORF type:complete len:247 (-),score=63.24 TRINITY_DN465_c0_g1_i4:153-893(-)
MCIRDRVSTQSTGTAMAAAQGTWEAAYNLAEIQNYVDWFNLMTYDLHGSWDGYTASQTAMDSTADSYTIKHAVSGYKSAGVPGSKIALGLALYGHTYAFSGASSTCPGYYQYTNGGAPGGHCTQASGMLAYYEIVELLGSATRKWDNTSLTPYICYSTYLQTPEKPLTESYRDQRNHYKHLSPLKPVPNLSDDSNGSGDWACYDDQESLSYKISYIKSQGLTGAMMWSVDMDYNNQLMTYVYNSLK